MQFLAAKDVVSRQSEENARRDLATAEAALRAANEKQKLVYAGPLPEADLHRPAFASRLPCVEPLPPSPDRVLRSRLTVAAPRLAWSTIA